MTLAELARLAKGDAAMRIFDILTHWLHEHPECSYSTGIGPSGAVVVSFIHKGQKTLFRGASIQDAYAQAAQAIDFNGGEL
jgi:hypothetical protein